MLRGCAARDVIRQKATCECRMKHTHDGSMGRTVYLPT